MASARTVGSGRAQRARSRGVAFEDAAQLALFRPLAAQRAQSFRERPTPVVSSVTSGTVTSAVSDAAGASRAVPHSDTSPSCCSTRASASPSMVGSRSGSALVSWTHASCAPKPSNVSLLRFARRQTEAILVTSHRDIGRGRVSVRGIRCRFRRSVVACIGQTGIGQTGFDEDCIGFIALTRYKPTAAQR